MIDFASQMEALNRQGQENNEEPALALTQSQKELRMIKMNREAINKRNEMVKEQNADIESSFDSSQLPEDKRSKNNNLKASFLDNSNLLRKEAAAKFLNLAPDEENLKTNQSGDPSEENIQDSIVILDVKDFGQPYTSRTNESGLEKPFDNFQSTHNGQNTINMYTFNSRVSRSIGRSEDFGPKIFKSDNNS